jgi:hypothetical protein
MRIGSFLSVLALALATGCNGQNDGGAAGSGGTAGRAGLAGGAGNTGNGGSAGTDGIAGSAGNAATAGAGGSGGSGPQCEQKADPNPVAFSVKDPNGAALPIGDYDAGTFDLQGTVRSVESASFSVEGCGTIEMPLMNAGGAGGEGGGDAPGGAGGGSSGDCDSGIWTIDATGPELVMPVETGMLVSIAFSTWCQPFSGCNRVMLVRDERTNGESLLLGMYAASFGGVTGAVRTPLEWPVALELVDLGCTFPTTPPPNTRGPVNWALRVAARESPASSVLLHMGESATLSLDADSDERWLARNVDSFDLGGYDASTSLSFYLAKRR